MGNNFKKNTDAEQNKKAVQIKKALDTLKNIGEESQSLYTLAKNEKNEILSFILSEDLKKASKNLYSARLLLGSTVSEEWLGIPEGLDKDMLRDLGQKPPNVDLADNIPKEAMVLITFSKSIVKKTDDILKLSSEISRNKFNSPKILRRFTFHLANQLEEISDNL